MCGMGVEYILKNSLLRRSLDNVTVVIIAFSNFKHTVFGHSSEKKEKESEQKVLDKRPVSTGLAQVTMVVALQPPLIMVTIAQELER